VPSLVIRKEQVTRTLIAIFFAMLTTGPTFAESRDSETVSVGPWTIATTYKGEKFDNCTMSRTASELAIDFVENSDGLLLRLDSAKWKLDRGRTYTIRLIAGSRSVDAKALAESKGVTVALVDRPFNESLRVANLLRVQGDGATLQVPLDGSAAAFGRLDACFNKNSREGVEANPFVAPSKKP
jgi:hypothetical protein